MHTNTTEGATLRGRVMDPIGCVPSRAWITISALENCNWNSQWRNNWSLDSQLNKTLWGTTLWEMMWSERSEFLRAPNMAIKAWKKARDAWRYSELCSFQASHATSPALGNRLMQSLMSALGFDFNRKLQHQLWILQHFIPADGFVAVLVHRKHELPPIPVWKLAHTGTKPLARKGIQSPLIIQRKTRWGQPKGSSRMLQSLSQSWAAQSSSESSGCWREQTAEGSLTHINPAAQETLQWVIKHLSVCFFKVQGNLHCRATPEMKHSYSAHVPSNSPFKNRCCVIELPPQFPDSFDWLQTEQNRTEKEKAKAIKWVPKHALTIWATVLFSKSFFFFSKRLYNQQPWPHLEG